MAINKVQFGNTILIDITDTTATAQDVMVGKYFYAANGVKTAGAATLQVPEVTITSSGSVSQELQPDTVYHFTSEAITDLTITFGGQSDAQYHFDFISPAAAATLTLPAAVVMPNSFSVEENSKYEIDIVNNQGVYAVWVYEVT